MNISEVIFSFKRDDYQRDNFDAFLKKISFSYDIPSIHIAGTNGKGSTATYLSNIYKLAGYKVGLFTSPSFKKINEMIKLNGVPVEDEDIKNIYNRYQKFFKKYELSSFEIITFIALTIFKEKNVDLAVIECGMGGEIDATNIFTPILSIITSVSIEHTAFLGTSLSEIALHKAGIIKPKIPVLIGNIEGDALNVIAEIAKKYNSKITKISPFQRENRSKTGYSFNYGIYDKLEISNLAETSITNACLALDAINILQEQFTVDKEAIYQGLKEKIEDGRFEVFEGTPTIIVDGAHNPDSISKLRKDVDQLSFDKPIHVVFASFKDKNITSMLPEIALLGEVTITTFDHPRARKEEDYFLYLEEYKFVEDHISLIKEMKEKYPEDIILITGSLAFAYLVADEIKNNVL